jgi:ribonuclease T1
MRSVCGPLALIAIGSLLLAACGDPQSGSAAADAAVAPSVSPQYAVGRTPDMTAGQAAAAGVAQVAENYPELSDPKAIVGGSVTTPALAMNDVERKLRAERGARAAAALLGLLFLGEVGPVGEAGAAGEGIGAARAGLSADAGGLETSLPGVDAIEAQGVLSEAGPQLAEALRRIETGGPFRFSQDGATFENLERRLPDGESYREYTVETPGAPDRGARRLVVDVSSGRVFYTPDHYTHFVRLR